MNINAGIRGCCPQRVTYVDLTDSDGKSFQKVLIPPFVKSAAAIKRTLTTIARQALKLEHETEDSQVRYSLLMGFGFGSAAVTIEDICDMIYEGEGLEELPAYDKDTATFSIVAQCAVPVPRQQLTAASVAGSVEADTPPDAPSGSKKKQGLLKDHLNTIASQSKIILAQDQYGFYASSKDPSNFWGDGFDALAQRLHVEFSADILGLTLATVKTAINRYCQGANRALKAHYNTAATEDPKTSTKPCSAEEAALRADAGQKWLRNYGPHRTAGTTPKCYPFISKAAAAKKGIYGGGDAAASAASAASSLLLVASGLAPGGASGGHLLLPPGGVPTAAAAAGARAAGAAAGAAARTAPRGHEVGGPFDADPEMPPEGARASGSHRHKERSLAALLEDPDARAFAAGMAGATQALNKAAAKKQGGKRGRGGGEGDALVSASLMGETQADKKRAATAKKRKQQQQLGLPKVSKTARGGNITQNPRYADQADEEEEQEEQQMDLEAARPKGGGRALTHWQRRAREAERLAAVEEASASSSEEEPDDPEDDDMDLDSDGEPVYP